MIESSISSVCRSGISRARSFDLEVTRWAPTRLTSSIFHSGHTEAYEPLRSTRCPARAPFNHLAAPGSARKPPVCRSGISRARSFDLEVTPWAPTRLTSSIFHSGHMEAYEPLRSTRRSARAPFHHLAAPESTRKPPVCKSGISGSRCAVGGRASGRRCCGRCQMSTERPYTRWPAPGALRGAAT